MLENINTVSENSTATSQSKHLGFQGQFPTEERELVQMCGLLPYRETQEKWRLPCCSVVTARTQSQLLQSIDNTHNNKRARTYVRYINIL